MSENLPYKLVTRLTAEDSRALESLAEQADCSVAQLSRYIIRKFIADKQKAANGEG